MPSTGSAVLPVEVRLWAGAAAAVGERGGPAEISVPVTGAVDLAWVRREVVRRYADRPELPAVLDACSVLVGDRPQGRRDPAAVVVAPGERVEFLPPFAGG